MIVVDEKEHARIESGNLLWAIGHGLLTWNQVQNLGDVVTGRVPLPDLRKSTILFGSHGLAVTDVAMAARTYELARAHGVGTEIRL